MNEKDYISLKDQLNTLFDEWRKKQKEDKDWHQRTIEGIEPDSFIEDGVVGSDYDGKVLFILVEANILTHRNEGVKPDQRHQFSWYMDYMQHKHSHKQHTRMGKMYQALINNNYTPSDLEIRTAIGKIGFMNLNKRGGSGNRKKGVLKNYVRYYYDEIKKQMSILNPEYIVCLGTYSILKDMDKEFEATYHPIDMYHPSCRYSDEKYMDIFRKRIEQAKQ